MKILAANYLFPGQGEALRNAALCISETGILLDILPAFKEAEHVSFYDGILCPGMINVHCHTELGDMKAKIPPGNGLTAFVRSVVRIRQTETLTQATASRYDQHNYNQGVDAIGDICNSTDSLLWKPKSKIAYHNFVEVFGSDPSRSADIWTKAQSLLSQFQAHSPHSGISPHALYSMSPELLHQSLLAAFESGMVTIHFRESREETTLFSARSDQDYMNYFIDQLELIPEEWRRTAHLLLIHCTFATPEEIARIVQRVPNTYIGLCPRSNLYIENALPDIPSLLQTGARMCLGTDSLASNRDLNLLEEILCIHQSYPDIPFFSLLEWACRNGADCLNFKHLGRWEIGKPIQICQIEGLNLSTFLPTDKAYTKRI